MEEKVTPRKCDACGSLRVKTLVYYMGTAVQCKDCNIICIITDKKLTRKIIEYAKDISINPCSP